MNINPLLYENKCNTIVANNDFSESFNYDIYPNYIHNGRLTILLDSIEELDVSITIYDLSNRTVFQSFEVCHEYLRLFLDLSFLNEGVYFIKIGNQRLSKVKRFYK